jgi:putative transposase
MPPGAPDLVGRRWRVKAPNLLVVGDLTYVAMVAGFGHTAFVIDAYAGLIPGWECSLSNETALVERALRHAAALRARQGRPLDHAIHQSDAGPQYAAIHFTETPTRDELVSSGDTRDGSGQRGAGPVGRSCSMHQLHRRGYAAAAGSSS